MSPEEEHLILEGRRRFGPGLCACGCGAMTALATRGGPQRFLPGHTEHRSIRQRFEAFLVVDETTGCRIWTGYRDRKGYGRIRLGGRRGRPVLAHRLAFILAGGILTPEKPFVLHNCPSGDNPSCCEAAHLWAGTLLDNNQDMARKSRGTRSAQGSPYGVTRHGRGYKGAIKVFGQCFYLGTFDSPEQASAAVLEARRNLRGF